MPHRARAHDVVLVTSAPKSRDEEIDERRRRYTITMAVRTALFVASVFLFHGVLRFIAAGLSLVLPWLAVVVANAGPRPSRARPEYVGDPEAAGPRGLPPGGAILDAEPADT